MKPFEKFLNDTLGTKELLETYLELRQEFQRLGFSENELEKPPTYSPMMMRLFHKFGDTQKALFNQVKDYGFDITFIELIKALANNSKPAIKPFNTKLTTFLKPSNFV